MYNKNFEGKIVTIKIIEEVIRDEWEMTEMKKKDKRRLPNHCQWKSVRLLPCCQGSLTGTQNPSNMKATL